MSDDTDDATVHGASIFGAVNHTPFCTAKHDPELTLNSGVAQLATT